MSNTLKKLATSALAVPGMMPFVQAQQPAESEAAYRFTFYSEDDSPASRTDGGAQERYQIQVHQFYLLMPYGSNMSLDVEGSFESMSGASPAYTYLDEEGVTRVYMSGASIEQRFDLYAQGRYYWSQAEAGIKGGFSIERDYRAVSTGIDGSLQINDQMTTLSGGISVGYDVINPTQDFSDTELQQANTPGRFAAKDQSIWQVSVYQGVGQIVDMNTVVQAGISVTHRSGYLSDPYREYSGAVVPYDIRPDNRTVFTLNTGLRRFMPNFNAALHADVRFLVDTWDIFSSTVELGWYQNFAPDIGWMVNNGVAFQVVPKVRYYQQTEAYFYEIPDHGEADPFYTADTTRYYSSDPRLSNYGALSGKLSLKTTFRSFAWNLTGERYVANPAYGFNASEETPGLPSFWRISTGLDYRF
ncbi:MAG: DUF3570 domain-containing protein [Saccharospirillum sp.]|nr:DUF3570 domain-containing protein [Saccharospirillum sp.]